MLYNEINLFLSPENRFPSIRSLFQKQKRKAIFVSFSFFLLGNEDSNLCSYMEDRAERETNPTHSISWKCRSLID
jgi:hypothetical protein